MRNSKIFKNYKSIIVAGAILIIAGVVMGVLINNSSAFAAGSGMLVGLGSVFLVFGAIMILRKDETVIDERTVLHSLKATRFAMMLGVFAVCGFLIVSTLKDPSHLRWDYFIFLIVMVIGKLSARLYYRLTN